MLNKLINLLLEQISICLFCFLFRDLQPEGVKDELERHYSAHPIRRVLSDDTRLFCYVRK